MSKRTTVAVLCGLLVLADMIILKQMLAQRGMLSYETFIAAVSATFISGILLSSIGIALLRRNYRRQKKPVKARARLAVAGL